MQIYEIFNSIEGEGIRAGYLTTFVRFYGCNLKCSYCDTQYSCVGDAFTEMQAGGILQDIRKISLCRYITLTGGEPLLQSHITRLVSLLIKAGYFVNIETNGSQDLKVFQQELIELFGGEYYLARQREQLIITMDWKSISSGESSKMLIDNVALLQKQDVLKFVVGSPADLEEMAYLYRNTPIGATVIVSPIFGVIEPCEIVKFLQQEALINIRMQIQMHKVIWPPDMRGV